MTAPADLDARLEALALKCAEGCTKFWCVGGHRGWNGEEDGASILRVCRDANHECTCGERFNSHGKRFEVDRILAALREAAALQREADAAAWLSAWGSLYHSQVLYGRLASEWQRGFDAAIRGGAR